VLHQPGYSRRLQYITSWERAYARACPTGGRNSGGDRGDAARHAWVERAAVQRAVTRSRMKYTLWIGDLDSLSVRCWRMFPTSSGRLSPERQDAAPVQRARAGVEHLVNRESSGRCAGGHCVHGFQKLARRIAQDLAVLMRVPPIRP
jgi:hypothetical protein